MSPTPATAIVFGNQRRVPDQASAGEAIDRADRPASFPMSAQRSGDGFERALRPQTTRRLWRRPRALVAEELTAVVLETPQRPWVIGFLRQRFGLWSSTAKAKAGTFYGVREGNASQPPRLQGQGDQVDR